MTEALATITYASVVSRDTVRIALMIATINDLEVKFCNILNAFVQAPVTKKVWILWILNLLKMPERQQ